MTSAERGQVKIADETYRRVLSACSTVPSIDPEEYAAKIALVVHRARFLAIRKVKP